MTPLYSKETADRAIDLIDGDRWMNLKGHLGDACTIIRLIENGNEVMEALDFILMMIRSEGYHETPDSITGLIKKIKGEE